MKWSLLIAVAAILTTCSTSYAQSCNCQSHAPVMHTTACDSCCQTRCCFNPLQELVQGVGYTLKSGACHIKNGVNRLLCPITFCNKGCCGHEVASTGCGCGAETHGHSYEMMSPGVEYIQTPTEAEPSIPGPPPTPKVDAPTTMTSEPGKLKVPSSWHPSSSDSARASRAQQLYGRTPTRTTARPATYYAPAKK